MMSINTNAGALSALQVLNRTNLSMEITQSRINTGLKVASAKDDGATYAIAQKLRSDVAGLGAVKNSLDRAMSSVDVALAAGAAISDLLIEMKEKAVAAADTGLDDDSKSSLDSDYQQLLAQVDSIANSAVFNGKNLLTGDSVSAITSPDADANISTSITSLTATSLSIDSTSLASGGSTSNATVATGSGNSWQSGDELSALNNYMEANFNAIYTGGDYDNATGNFTNFGDAVTAGTQIQADFSFSAGVLASSGNFLYVDSGSLYVEGTGASAAFTASATSSSGGDPSAAVTAIDAAIDTVNTQLSKLGSTSKRLELQREFTTKLSDTIKVGIGNLVDADMAKESANLQAYQVKQQLGLQALSIANQAPGTILGLFR